MTFGKEPAKSEEIPKTQKAAVFTEHGGEIKIQEIPVPEIGVDDVLVKVLYSGVCGTDLHVWRGDLPVKGKDFPIVGGHEGIGIVVKVGQNVTNFKVGDRAGIKWINSSCLSCSECIHSYEQNCPNAMLSGLTRDGSFQQYAVVCGNIAAKIPEDADLKGCAPVLCAGVTAYKALLEANIKAGEIIAIVGAGGGLGTMAIQYARAMGYRPLAIDGSSKEKLCKEMGAEWFIDHKTENLVSEIRKLTKGGPHAVMCLAPIEKAMNQACEYVRTRGTVVLVALPKDARVSIDVFSTVFRAITVKGSYVGNREDTVEAIEFFSRGLIKIPVEIQPLSQLPNVFDRMHKGEINGRIVLDLWN
ncbi:hypothetical protein M3Y94_00108500 [Aphelenchoides besseyi]|nr:hypothetical protein M3Y94_00108500 [Aphelenchoides besseyi]